MTAYTRRIAPGLIVTVLLLALPMSIHAWELNVRDRDAAIKSGNLDAYVANLGKWVSQKVPASITKKSIDALFNDPAFMSAVIERRFITRVWGPPSLGDWAKADPKNAKFVSWVTSNPKVMDMALLTRTPSVEWARVDDSWSIHIAAVKTWQEMYYADAASREGLYLRIAVACALRPPGTGNRGAGEAKEQSSCLDRYMHYRKAHAAKELFPSFDNLTTWELTHVVSSPASNADLAWGREALNTWNPGFRRNENVVAMVGQVWRRGSQVPYHDFSCVAAGGGKCGPRSSFGVFINQAFGIPSIGVGQPGHAAITFRDMNGDWQMAQGRGFHVSKIQDRYKMSGPEFVAMTQERKTPIFARTEHLRWLAGTLEKPDGGYLPPDNRHYANPRATAVYALRTAMSAVYGNIKDTPFERRKPDKRSTLSKFQSPISDGDMYFARVRGYVYPPQSGDYVFSITADDAGDLFLSTDDEPGNRQFIVCVTDWAEPTDFSKKSKPVRLTAGKKYYIEAVHNENAGGDHIAVAWKGPGVSEGVISGRYLSPYPSGVRGTINREVWEKRATAAAAAKSDFKPERPIKVAPGVIHVEAEDCFTNSNVGVENCYTGGKQVYYPALTAHAMCGYKINVPKTGTYGFTARVAVINWGQRLYIRSFGAMYPVKSAKVSNVFRNQQEVHGPGQAIDHDLTTRWAMDFGKDKGWIELDLGQPRKISKIIIDERALNYIKKHQIDYRVGDAWHKLLEGDYIKNYVKSFPPVTARYVRLSSFDTDAPTGGPTVRDFSVGDVLDGNGFVDIPWAPAMEKDKKGGMSGRWQTTKPMDMYLAKGEQKIWVCTQTLPAQRSVAMRWFELKPKGG